MIGLYIIREFTSGSDESQREEVRRGVPPSWCLADLNHVNSTIPAHSRLKRNVTMCLCSWRLLVNIE
jgi:hypothetical protein